MTKTWLMRRAVRRPVSLRTTSAISSSVCRLPFISASASPARTICTAFSAAAWLWAVSTICIPRDRGAARRPGGDARVRSDQHRTYESGGRGIQRRGERVCSHGCTTAVRMGESARQAAIHASYFWCLRAGSIAYLGRFRFDARGPWPRAEYGLAANAHSGSSRLPVSPRAGDHRW